MPDDSPNDLDGTLAESTRLREEAAQLIAKARDLQQRIVFLEAEAKAAMVRTCARPLASGADSAYD